MPLKLTLKGGKGSGWFAPPKGSHVGDEESGGAFGEGAIRSYSMMRQASFMTPETAQRVMAQAMTNTAKLSTAKKGKVTTLSKLRGLYRKRLSDLSKEHAIVVPKSGLFAGIPLQVKGYGQRKGKTVTHWDVAPLDSKGKMLRMSMVIPSTEL